MPRRVVISGLGRMLAHGPWHQVSIRRSRRRLVVLAYHGVADRSRFADQLDRLLNIGSPVSLAQVVGSARHGAELPVSPVLVTFDDGDVTVLEHALPELRTRGIPAVAFVVTDMVGTALPHWWDEVCHLVTAGGRMQALPGSPGPAAAVRLLKQMPDHERRTALDELRATASGPAPPARQLSADDLRALETGGITVGSHTMSHPCLPQCTSDVMRSEVSGARARLQDLLGHPPTAFAYPNGDHDLRVRRAVEEAGHEVAFCFDHRLSSIPPLDPLRISRVRIDAAASVDRFTSIASGLHPMLYHLRARNVTPALT